MNGGEGWVVAEMEMEAAEAAEWYYNAVTGQYMMRRRGITMEELEKEQRTQTEINARQENRIENLQSKVNELIGFYLVFQGVVLTSVAQGSMLRCHNWWLPFSLSCIAAFAIMFAVVHMLLKLQRCKVELERNLDSTDRLTNFIMIQKFRLRAAAISAASASSSSAADINIAAHYPTPPPNFDADEESHISYPPLPLYRLLYRLVYPAIVLLILLTFTAFVLVSCRRILCFPGPLPEGDTPMKSGGSSGN